VVVLVGADPDEKDEGARASCKPTRFRVNEGGSSEIEISQGAVTTAGGQGLRGQGEAFAQGKTATMLIEVIACL